MNKLPFLVTLSKSKAPFLFSLVALCGVAELGAADIQRVTLSKTPNDGIQPQVVLDARGMLHLIYFRGNPSDGDLFYVRRERDQKEFSKPIRVNSQPGTAVATGTIRGGQLAIGKNGRAHVAWNGSGKAVPRGPSNTSPMLYARLNDAGTAFEPQQNLMHASYMLDGGGTVAADAAGNVYVAWHGLPIDGERGEEHRRVWIARSRDEGKTFAREAPAFAQPTGACGCCGMRAYTDRQGAVYLIYRSASEKVHRDMYLLASLDLGEHFNGTLLQPWQIGTCPMSSEAFAEGPNGAVTAWETAGQVYFARIDPAGREAVKPQSAPGSSTQRKHPSLAVNQRGDLLLVWTEGTGWQRGGALAWQVFDRSGQPTGEKGRLEGGVPVWGLATAVALPDGSFHIIH